MKDNSHRVKELIKIWKSKRGGNKDDKPEQTKASRGIQKRRHPYKSQK